MIIETSGNQLYAVRETGDPSLTHVWKGIAVRRAKIRGTYETKPGATTQLVRKAAARVVSNYRVGVP
jgi:hypothetical protein